MGRCSKLAVIIWVSGTGISAREPIETTDEPQYGYGLGEAWV